NLPETGQLELALADVGLLQAVVGDTVVERVRPVRIGVRDVGESRRGHRRVVLERGVVQMLEGRSVPRQ
ncbi:hypothetical protein B8W95_14230, partial [Staphylococcus pasteuri]